MDITSIIDGRDNTRWRMTWTPVVFDPATTAHDAPRLPVPGSRFTTHCGISVYYTFLESRFTTYFTTRILSLPPKLLHDVQVSGCVFNPATTEHDAPQLPVVESSECQLSGRSLGATQGFLEYAQYVMFRISGFRFARASFRERERLVDALP